LNAAPQGPTLNQQDAETLLRCYILGSFLNEVVSVDGYKPPVQLTTALKLTAKGSRLANQIKGNSVDLREAQLAAFMTVWSGNDLLVDLKEIDIDKVRSSLSSEIKRQKLKLPWIYGRKLYDKIADSPFHGDSHPTPDETSNLLGGMPPGVFQLGPYLSGPYGLVETRQWRNIFFFHTVPGFHCVEQDCNTVHGISMASPLTGIKRALDALRQKTLKVRNEVASLNDAVSEIEAKHVPPFRWNNSSRLPFLLYDCFPISDIRLLLSTLLDQTDGTLRAEIAKLNINIGRADQFVESLDDAGLLQLILLAMDNEIHGALNRLIWDGNIDIPEGEIRRPRIVTRGVGPLEVMLEASSLGVRYRPHFHNLPIRLQGIIDQAYPLNDKSAQSTLNWLLRQYEGDSSLAKLTVALAEADPLNLVERLLVAGEHTYSIGLRELGLPKHSYSQKPDREIARLITWHIGIAMPEKDTELDSLRENLSKLKQIIGSLPATFLERADVSRIQEVAGRLFPDFEGILKSVLCFTTWALLHDHYEDGYSLSYSNRRGRDFFDTWTKSQENSFVVAQVEGMALGDLISSFAVLSKHLNALDRDRLNYIRPHLTWPSSAREESNPFDFPFEHKYPYLDLSDTSRKSIREILSRIAVELSRNEVASVRNQFLHHRSETPDRDKLTRALASIETAVSDMVGNGIYPLVFDPRGSENDNYGRRRFLFTCQAGPEVSLTRPAKLMTTGFPPVSNPQLILISGRLQKSGEPLRFASLKDSSYRSRWENFPRRPTRIGISLLSSDETDGME
jgi:hypothetical protein